MVATTAKTKKAKGTRLEKEIARLYRYHKIDDTARRMPLSGALSHFKGDIYKRFDIDYIDECKNHEEIKLREFWRQAKSQAGLKTPVLHISSNYRPIITVITQSDFDALTNPDRFKIIDICDKTKFNFWKYASMTTDLDIQGTVVFCVVDNVGLTLMTAKTYFLLRKEQLALISGKDDKQKTD